MLFFDDVAPHTLRRLAEEAGVRAPAVAVVFCVARLMQQAAHSGASVAPALFALFREDAGVAHQEFV